MKTSSNMQNRHVLGCFPQKKRARTSIIAKNGHFCLQNFITSLNADPYWNSPR